MNKLTIFNLYVKMESQSQCHRMKQLCLDNGLSIGTYFLYDKGAYFEYFDGDFCIFYTDLMVERQTSVTEQQFINLLKEYKDGK